MNKNTFQDISGQKFNRLTALKRAENCKHGSAQWLCMCDCGKEVIALGQKLRNGRTSSCGCFAAEQASKRFTKHGESNTRLFKIWGGMKSRCANPKTVGWNNYGGKGVRVCEIWASDFTAFKSWAIENGYKDNLTLDRKNNQGNYEPSNCRWATMKEQASNKTNNVKLTDGRMAYEVANELGISNAQCRQRIREGMSLDEAVFTPHKRLSHKLLDGRLGVEVAASIGVSASTFNMRVSGYGWSVERAATTPTRKINR